MKHDKIAQRNSNILTRFQKLLSISIADFPAEILAQEFNLSKTQIFRILRKAGIHGYQSKIAKTKLRNINLTTRFQELFPKNNYKFAIQQLTVEFKMSDYHIIQLLCNQGIPINHDIYKGKKYYLQLTPVEIEQLNILILDCYLSDKLIKRYQLLLLLHQGYSFKKIIKLLPCAKDFIPTWYNRFLALRKTLPKVPENPDRQPRMHSFHERSWNEILDDTYYEFRYALYAGLHDSMPIYHRTRLHKLTEKQDLYLRALALTDPLLFDLQNLADLKYQPTYWTLFLLHIAAINNLQPYAKINNDDPTPTTFPTLPTPIKLSWKTLKVWFLKNEIDLKPHPYWNPHYHGGNYLFRKEEFY